MKAGVDNGDGAIIVPLLVGHRDGDGIVDCKDDDHGFVSGTTSFFNTCFNSVNALAGVGILSLPHAVSSGGWLSLIFFFLVAASAYYTALLIQRCLDMDKNLRSYSDIGGRAFGSKGRAIVSIATNIELYLVATGFLILEGDNLYDLFPDIEYNIGGLVLGGRKSFIVIIGFLILPTVWLNNMSILSYISATGVMASFVLIGSVLWAAVFDGIGFRGKGTFVNLKGFPIALSLYAFCYCAHPVFPILYNSMKDQKKFSKVMLVCFLVTTTSYAFMAVLGYLMFGSKVASQVTLNLPTSKTSSKVAIYTTLVNPFAKYALMLKPVISALENRLTSCPNRGLSILIRTGLVLSTIIVAVAIPFFGYLMSLVGAFLSVSASIILPCVCFLKISGSYRRFGFEMMLIWVIVLVGCVILVFGTYTALHEIIERLL
ncbi:amino acid transporter AVT1I-like [Primulina huaijiensis]|uniref:amino acid transporter AVT1I-like n=1 Tax=Primulina huaijiensis TaxID=1492673 RepID=UPI003CC74EEB